MSEGTHHPLTLLARAAIEAYVCTQRTLQPAEAPEPVAGQRAGVFVTLHLADTHELRGCIGTIEPCEESLAAETIHNAIAAATRDPRFSPVTVAELPRLEISVSVLQAAEAITGMEQLDPSCYGVIVQRGRRRGLLLPDIPGIEDADTQVAIARQKAWIGPAEPVSLFRFRVEKYC